MAYRQFASFPSPSEPPVPPEVFNSFHTIDRNLFCRLVFQLGRDPTESARVMALWLWVESMNVHHLGQHWIQRVLLPSYPGPLNAFANESVTVLNCIERDGPAPGPIDLPMFRTMTATASVTLQDFYDDRFDVSSGVSRMLERVCNRAFQDLIARAVEERAAAAARRANPRTGLGRGRNAIPMTVMMRVPLRFDPMVASPPPMPPMLPLSPPQQFVRFMPPPPPLPQYVHHPGMHHPGMVTHPHHVRNYAQYGGPSFGGAVNPNDDLLGLRGINFEQDHQELSENMRGLELSDNNNGTAAGDEDQEETEDQTEKDVVPVDERTIFLTFSKGYPVTESEVRDFFTSKFGGQVIEAIHMQDVRSSNGQPLYARLVVRSLPSVDVILEGRNKMKFSIAGKHIWARKYVRKNVPNLPSKIAEEPQELQPGTST